MTQLDPKQDTVHGRRRSPARRTLRVLAGCALAAVLAGLLFVSVGPRVLPYRTYFVRSGSMRPVLPVGSLAIYERADAQQLHVGDVIAFTPPGGTALVTHRIVTMDRAGNDLRLTTKGDANAQPDPWQIHANGGGWRLVHVVPSVGYVFGTLATAPARAVIFGATTFGLVLLAFWRLAFRRRPSPQSAVG